MYNVHRTICILTITIQYTIRILFSIHYIEYSIHYSIHYILYSIHNTVCNINYTLIKYKVYFLLKRYSILLLYYYKPAQYVLYSRTVMIICILHDIISTSVFVPKLAITIPAIRFRGRDRERERERKKEGEMERELGDFLIFIHFTVPDSPHILLLLINIIIITNQYIFQKHNFIISIVWCT